MGDDEPASRRLIDWGVAARALPGQVESGDLHLVKPFPNGVLVAVVDGLGHGDEAALAARTAVTTLDLSAGEPVVMLMKLCHERLKRTRGVVMSLAAFNALDGTMTWLGIGNVEGVLLRAEGATNRPEHVPLRGGVVGYQLPPPRAEVVPVRPGDTLILATDGIDSAFARGVSPRDPPQRIADRILAQHGKRTDDVLVLVARYVGPAP